MDPTPDAASPCCPDPDDGEPRLPTGGGRRSSGEDGGARSDPGGSGRDGSIYDGFGMEAVGSGEIEGRWRHGPPGDPCSARKRDRGEMRSRGRRRGARWPSGRSSDGGARRRCGVAGEVASGARGARAGGSCGRRSGPVRAGFPRLFL